MSDLIDTTEMYLRTIFELSEEGVRPMRARIAERLSQSGPTVSQTVARMQRDGLVELDADDRHLMLTPTGSQLATRVMRKHRLAECMLVDVIGLPWEEVHAEACRWEHVMSDDVERRLLAILGNPTHSPFGNPIPGLAELATEEHPAGASDAAAGEGVALSTFASAEDAQPVMVLRIGETLQAEEATMADLRRLGATPGGRVRVARSGDRVRIGAEGEDDQQWGDSMYLAGTQAGQIIVAAAG